MRKNVKLLLTENVDNLGIVGDVVNVRLGYARNFLLPRGMATKPSDDLIQSLAAKRADAEKEVAALRKKREEAIQKIDGLDVTMQRACNDQGILYGGVTQNDIAEALTQLGFPVRPREVRLPGSIKRIDAYEVTVKFANDLEGTVKIHVVPDRTLQEDEREEMEFDNEGNLVDKSRRRGRDRNAEAGAEPAAAGAPQAPAARSRPEDEL